MAATQIPDDGPSFAKSLLWAMATLALFTVSLGALWHKSEAAHPSAAGQVAGR